MQIQTNTVRNYESRGSSHSVYLKVQSESNLNATYDVTINFDTGHWCTCKANLGLVRKYGKARDPFHHGDWCKHVRAVLLDAGKIVEAGAQRDSVVLCGESEI